ncbi:MAG TPA: carboxypeptidase-like regulatory domain-containing protein, partial [Thermoanaerobaculia bacterium]|nr:carboxypeptidase-like regulatory domain-containing protein [Thermoanaerobaculia bacterium]
MAKNDELDHVVAFDNVTPGRYVVTARGAEAWQRAGERVDVFEWELAPVHVQLAPFGMRLRAVADGQPLRNARIVLRHHEAFWEAPVRTDESGEAAIELWQLGSLSAQVQSGGAVPFRVRRTLKEAEDTEWLLEMPEREVIGTVVDAQTGAPVPNASVALDMQSRSEQLAVTVDAAEDGTFRFAPVFPGAHTLQAAARHYPVTKIAYTFEEEEETHEVTIALERQPKTTLGVVDARGRAMANAGVYVFHAGRAVAFTRTGRDGTAAVFVPQKEEREVWIVPADGSFGVTTIASGAPHARIAIADGSSRIVVRTESEAEKP